MPDSDYPFITEDGRLNIRSITIHLEGDYVMVIDEDEWIRFAFEHQGVEVEKDNGPLEVLRHLMTLSIDFIIPAQNWSNAETGIRSFIPGILKATKRKDDTE